MVSAGEEGAEEDEEDDDRWGPSPTDDARRAEPAADYKGAWGKSRRKAGRGAAPPQAPPDLGPGAPPPGELAHTAPESGPEPAAVAGDERPGGEQLLLVGKGDGAAAAQLAAAGADAHKVRRHVL